MYAYDIIKTRKHSKTCYCWWLSVVVCCCSLLLAVIGCCFCWLVFWFVRILVGSPLRWLGGSCSFFKIGVEFGLLCSCLVDWLLACLLA